MRYIWEHKNNVT